MVIPKKELNGSIIIDLCAKLDDIKAEYTILTHTKNINTIDDACKFMPESIDKFAPTLILRSDVGYLAAIICGDTRISFKKIKKQLSLKDISMADPDFVKQITGCEPGRVSLVNPLIKTIIDQRVLEKDFVYGGCGLEKHTLKIAPTFLVLVNHAFVFDFTEKKQKSNRKTNSPG